MLTAFIRNLRDVLDSRTLRREFEVDGLGNPNASYFPDSSPTIPDYRMNHEAMSAILFFSSEIYCGIHQLVNEFFLNCTSFRGKQTNP